MYSQINRQLPEKIKFSNLSLSVFPLGINIKNIKNFPIVDKNLVSFKHISIEIPFWSLFSRLKEVDMIIHQPKIVIDKTLFKKSTRPGKIGSNFSIRAIKISNGSLRYTSKKLTVILKKFNLDSVGFTNYTAYQLNSPLLKLLFPMSGKRVSVEGNLTTKFKQYQGSIKINKFFWSTRKFRIHAHGKIFKDSSMTLNTFFQGNPESILYPLLKELTISGFTYGNARISVDKNQKISVSGRFKSNTFSCSGQNFSDLQGRVTWDNISNHVHINTYFLDDQYRVNLKIDANDDDVHLIGTNMQGNSIAKVIDIYRDVPLDGIVEKADISVKNKIISGTVHLKNKTDYTPDFNIKGNFRFRYDSGRKIINFHSDRLFSEFGELSLTGEIILPLKKTDLSIHSKINEAGNINKYSLYFINLNLDPWKLKGGKGTFHLNYKRRRGNFRFNSTFRLNHFFSHLQPVDFLDSQISGENDIIKGDFNINDQFLKGRARLSINKENVRIDFVDVAGESQKILRLLGLDIDLKGPMKGEFCYIHPKQESLPQIQGHFSSKNLIGYNIHFDNIKGNLNSNLEYIHLKNLKYRCYRGDGTADILIDYVKKNFNLNGEVSRIKVNQIHPGFNGIAELRFSGQGQFNLDLIRLNYHIKDFSYYNDRQCNVSGQAHILTDFSDYDFKTIGFIHHQGQKSPFNIQLNQKNQQYSGI
ncbi:MAG: hypothetical protein KAT17_01920, partial [Candidatus Aminicenantes bacterium]|nr:hypothetical protein [Candidatus Aminicenantes bacterium]